MAYLRRQIVSFVVLKSIIFGYGPEKMVGTDGTKNVFLGF